MWAVYALACVGGLVVTAIVVSFVRELVRSVRQAGRVATVAARAIERRRKPTIRQWLYSFRREFGAGYSTIRIGGFEIPHDPSEPIRSAW